MVLCVVTEQMWDNSLAKQLFLVSLSAAPQLQKAINRGMAQRNISDFLARILKGHG